MCRALIVAEDGRAFYDATYEEKGFLVRYDPKSNTVTKTTTQLPGDGTLRAASRQDANGMVYCFTKDGVAFSLETKNETIKEITKAFVAGPLYTTVCKLGPEARYLYYAPGAHGRTWQNGTAVLRLDLKTGRREVIAFLNAYLREQRKYNLGGTYGLSVNSDGSKLLICWNGGLLAQKKNDFGLCSAMILGLPED